MIPAVKAAAVFLTIAVVVVWVAGRRSREQAETARRQARVRAEALARSDAGMPAGHPENPMPPGPVEQLMDGAVHAFIAAQLADIEVTGGQP